MKNTVKLKGRLKSYLQSSLYLGFLLAVVDILIYMLDYRAGLVVTAFLIFYIAIVLSMMLYNKPIIMNELISFATQYGQIQRRLLRDLELPHALLDDSGKVIWTNIAFERITHQPKGCHKSITTLFSAITKDKLPGQGGGDEVECRVEFENGNYVVKLKKISLKEMAENSDIIEAKGYEGYLIALYMFDETALQIALKEVDNQSLTVALIYLDNYEEALESVEEVRRSLLIALIDRKVNKYIAALDGICKKLEKDKYLVILRKEAALHMQESRFDLLEDVKT
ncbi:MAG: DHH family phosphoesterase, partial [Lachnospiraceae bacterium]|nr:DHH family phosphoesterase [Lachnospiraceae bacterium]